MRHVKINHFIRSGGPRRRSVEKQRVVFMGILFKLLILLSITVFSKFNLDPTLNGNLLNEYRPIIKGPVFNPLRKKPFVKHIVNA